MTAPIRSMRGLRGGGFELEFVDGTKYTVTGERLRNLTQSVGRDQAITAVRGEVAAAMGEDDSGGVALDFDESTGEVRDLRLVFGER